MEEAPPDPFYGLFARDSSIDGVPRLTRQPDAPAAVPDPATGRSLRIATVDIGSTAICPDCRTPGVGGHISFVADLRMAYACPVCEHLVWVPGA